MVQGEGKTEAALSVCQRIMGTTFGAVGFTSILGVALGLSADGWL
jgi:hypothetical protein